MPYCIYLRKSRADAESEARGEGETLARHEKILMDLAARRHLEIVKIYREIVSGDNIASRPQMQQLLADLEEGMYDGVLVMEVERLARGDTIDQGIVAQAFKYSGVKIITPIKDYDPNNEFDEEYFEFGLFMSRREYKVINRRLQRGRFASAKEGHWLSWRPPYGYRIIPIEGAKGHTLEIVPENAQIVRMIFEWYTVGLTDKDGITRPIGFQKIAAELNRLGITSPRHDYWMSEGVKMILTNPVYAGWIRYGYHKIVKRPNQMNNYTFRNEGEYVLAKGLHEAIISQETFDLAQKTISEKPAMPIGYKNEIKGSLAGLMICQKCGRKMVFRRRRADGHHDYLVCHCRSCSNISSPYDYVEAGVISALQNLLHTYEYELAQSEKKENPQIADLEKVIKSIEKELNTLKGQLSSAQTMVERGVYTVEEYVERSKTIKKSIKDRASVLEETKARLEQATRLDRQRSVIIPKIKYVLTTFPTLTAPGQKNALLKEVISSVDYLKETPGTNAGGADVFSLTLHPKIL